MNTIVQFMNQAAVSESLRAAGTLPPGRLLSATHDSGSPRSGPAGWLPFRLLSLIVLLTASLLGGRLHAQTFCNVGGSIEGVSGLALGIRIPFGAGQSIRAQLPPGEYRVQLSGYVEWAWGWDGASAACGMSFQMPLGGLASITYPASGNGWVTTVVNSESTPNSFQFGGPSGGNSGHASAQDSITGTCAAGSVSAYGFTSVAGFGSTDAGGIVLSVSVAGNGSLSGPCSVTQLFGRGYSGVGAHFVLPQAIETTIITGSNGGGAPPAFPDGTVPAPPGGCEWQPTYLFSNATSEGWFAVPSGGSEIRFDGRDTTRFTGISDFPEGQTWVDVAGTGHGPFTRGQAFSFAGFPDGSVSSFSVRPSTGSFAGATAFQLALNAPTGSFAAKVVGPSDVRVDLERLSQGLPPSMETPQFVTRGETVRFAARVPGNCANTYQWRRNSVAIPGETGPTLTLTDLTPEKCGAFSVVVQNELGTAESPVLTIQQLLYSLTVNAPGGTVERTPDQAGYEPGTVVTLQAVPQPGQFFAGWDGDVHSTANPLEITMNQNRTVNAWFGRPFGGTPWTVPGMIQAEDFDEGGEGVGYHDADTANQGGSTYRAGGVDVLDSADGKRVGWNASGEWLHYTVNVASAGWYRAVLRTSSGASGGTAQLRFSGGQMSDPIPVPGTGAWDAMVYTASAPFALPAGIQVVHLDIVQAGFDVDSFELVPVQSTPFGGTPWPVPGVIQAEDFDEGGEGWAYHDADAANLGGSLYRTEGVDIVSWAGGERIGWTANGEWLHYTVDVAAAGSYRAVLRLSGDGVIGTARLRFSGGQQSELILVGGNGSWDAMVERVSEPFVLPAGIQVLQMDIVQSGFDLDSIELQLIQPANSPPVAYAQTVTTPEDTSLEVTFSAEDADNDALTYTVVTDPAHGTLSGTAPNLIYTPDANYYGPDSFTFKVNDDAEDSAPATVSITVTPVNDLPVANNQSVTTAEDTAVTVTLAGSDVDGDVLTFAVVSGPAHGTLSGTAPALTYTPEAGWFGEDSFAFNATDTVGASATATVTITVNEVIPDTGDHLWAWGRNVEGQLGNGEKGVSLVPDSIQIPAAWAGHTVRSVSAGYYHSMAVLDDGTLWAWGHNYWGQLGNGSYSALSAVPVAVKSPTAWAGRSVQSVTGGNSQTVALLDDGTVWTWGNNANGQLGIGSTTSQSAVPMPVQAPAAWTGHAVKAVAAGNLHMAAILDDGSVWSWGYNNNGQLGDGGTTQSRVPVAVQAPAAWAGHSVQSVAAGAAHTVAILDDGTVWVWGNNANGQLGNGTTSQSVVPVPVQAPAAWAGHTVKAVAAGSAHTVAILDDGTVWTWGGGGVLGTGNTAQSTVPVPVQAPAAWAGHAVESVVAGSGHTVAVLDDGTAWAWGSNGNGQLGIGSTSQSLVPVPVQAAAAWADHKVQSVSAGGGAGHTMALLDDGTVWCWGDNYYSQLGNGDLSLEYLPASVQAPVAWVGHSVQSVATGYYHTMALLEDGTLWGWGWNIYGQLGTGNYNQSSEPLPVLAAPAWTGHTIRSVAAGAFHSTAVLDDGTVWSWGYNSNGQLGTGTIAGSAVPRAVQAPATWAGHAVQSVAAGYSHTVALLDDGTIWSWGANFSGQLGTGSTSQSTVPVAVVAPAAWAGLAVKSVSAGQGHTVALLEDGTVWSWGSNGNGQLGTGNTSQSAVPVRVQAPAGWTGHAVKSIAAGAFHSAAVLDDGTIWSWGLNNGGQLGNGSTLQSLVPVAVQAPATWAGHAVESVYAGYYHAVAVLDDGTVWCWGSNGYGQLGTGNISQSTVPAAVQAPAAWAGHPVKAMAAGYFHTVVVVTGGDAYPVTGADSYSTAEDAALSVAAPGLLSNDVDPDGDAISVVSVTQPAHGTVSFGADGAFTYTPAPNYHGSDSFRYVAGDGQVESAPTLVTITVNSVNDVPVTSSQHLSTPEDVPLAVALSASDVDGDPLTFSVISTPAHGTVSGTPPDLTYTPADNYHGSDSFGFLVSDGHGGQVSASINITVTPVNDAPVAVNDAYSLGEDMILSPGFAANGLLKNDTDADGDTLTAMLVSGTTVGTLVLQPDGRFTFTPPANFNGPVSFTYKVNDGQADSEVATVTITVNPANDAPVAVDDAYTVAEDGTLGVPGGGIGAAARGGVGGTVGSVDRSANFNTLQNGTDLSNYTEGGLRIATPGTAFLNRGGTYYPGGGANAPTSIRTSDGSRMYAVEFATFDGWGSGHAHNLHWWMLDGGVVVADGVFSAGDPLISGFSRGAGFDELLVGAYYTAELAQAATQTSYQALALDDLKVQLQKPGVLANDSDLDGDALTAQLVTTVQHGTLTLQPDGGFTYTPAANFNGADAFTYKVSDGMAESGIATVSITVNPANDAPVALAQSVTTAEDTAAVIMLGGTDVDGDALSFAVVNGPAHGTLSGTAPDLTYTPAANYHGADSFTFTVSDGTVTSAAAIVSIAVSSVNDAPVLSLPLADSSFATRFDLGVLYNPRGVLIADLDGDGKLDLIVANQSSARLSVFRNASASGEVSAASFPQRVDVLTGGGPWRIAVGDVDGDGKPDLAVVNAASSTVSVLRNTSTPGTINSSSLAPKVDLPVGEYPWDVALADLDGDGKLDLVTANYIGDSVSVLRNQATPGGISASSFAGKVDFVLGNGQGSVTAVVAADLNGDGRLDLAASHWALSRVFVLQNVATAGSIGPSSFGPKLEFATGSGAMDIAAADLDGDGKADLATANYSGSASILRNVAPPGAPLSAGSFLEKVDLVAGSQSMSINLGDLNGDGRPELVVANQGSDFVSVFENRASAGLIGFGSFEAGLDLPTGSVPVDVALGDLNGDGRAELLVANSSAHTVSVVGNRTGHFESIDGDPVNIPLAASDADGEPLVFSVTAQPAHGTVTGEPPGLTYTASVLQSGSDQFTVQVTDSAGAVATATIQIALVITDHPPVAVAGADQSAGAGTDCLATVTVDGSASSDADGDALSYAWELFLNGESVDSVEGEAAVSWSLTHGTYEAVLTVTTDKNGTIVSRSDSLIVQVLPGAPVLTAIAPAGAYAGGPAFDLTVTGGCFLPGATVHWNGQPRTTTVVHSGELVAAIPASDLLTGADIAVATVTVVNGDGQLSNPLGFSIVAQTVGTADAAVSQPGEITTVSTAPTTGGEPGVSVAVQNDGDQPVTVLAASYDERPVGETAFQVDNGAFVDVQVTGADANVSATVYFYYPSDVTGGMENRTRLRYFNGIDWIPVLSSGGLPPAKDTTDNLDNTVSGGRFTVIFDMTSTPTITELTGTVFGMFESLPQIEAVTGPSGPVALGSSVTVRVDYVALGAQDAVAVNFVWDDGSETPVVPQLAGSASATHLYAAPGVYGVTVQVVDGEGDLREGRFEYVVVYDPNGGFVTGGGWINSPPGAYPFDVTLAGKATFGFVSKYKKGTSVPLGETQFQFEAAEFKFHSSTYEWLVVSGAKSQFKGWGTVNSQGDYGFLVTSTDGQAKGGGGYDKFRIKIWDRASGTVVYDNVAGTSDDLDKANPQALGGGSIVIQGGK